MALSIQNPLVGGFSQSGVSKQNTGVSPQEWEYVQQLRRTGYDPSQFMQQNQSAIQSDPYSDFELEFSKCSPVVQSKILNDPAFKQSMLECDNLIQATVESLVRPQVMQTRDGRIVFEKLLATFRNIKDSYAKEEADNMERIQRLMQDDVVKQRLAEIEKQSVQSKGENN